MRITKNLNRPSRASIFYGILILLVLLAVFTRSATAPQYLESRDSFFFARGVENYDVSQRRPHWPGYPVYIWLGRLLNQVSPNTVTALHTLSILSTSLLIIPLALLTKGITYSLYKPSASNDPLKKGETDKIDKTNFADARNWTVRNDIEYKASLAGILAALLWLAVPISWLDGTEVFSDPTALLVGVMMLWCGWQAITRDKVLWMLATFMLAGFVIGIRISYIPLLVVLLIVTLQRYHLAANWRKPTLEFVFSAITFLLVVGMWLGWQIMVEGKTTYIEAAKEHLQGHYQDWGGSVSTNKGSDLVDRGSRWLNTYLVYGLGGWWVNNPLDFLRLMILVLFLILHVCVGIKLLTSKDKGPLLLISFWAVAYFIWSFLNHDVDLARYTFPLVAISCVLVAVTSVWAHWLKLLTIALVVMLNLVSIPLAREHKDVPPIDRQLEQYLKPIEKQRAESSEAAPQSESTKAKDSQIMLLIGGSLQRKEPTQLTSLRNLPYKYTRLMTSLKFLLPDYVLMQANLKHVNSQGRAMQARGFRVYFLSLIPEYTEPDSRYWQYEAKFCRNPLIKSRGVYDVELFSYQTEEVSQTSQDQLTILPENRKCWVMGEALVDSIVPD